MVVKDAPCTRIENAKAKTITEMTKRRDSEAEEEVKDVLFDLEMEEQQGK